MFLLVTDSYKDGRKGLNWPPGRIVEVDQKEADFFLVDAPGCFKVIPDGWNEEVTQVVQMALNKGTDEDLASLIELLDSPEANDPKVLKGMVEFMLDSIKEGPASELDKPPEPEGWDELTVPVLKQYLENFNPEDVKGLSKKDDIIKFLEGWLGDKIVPMVLVPDHLAGGSDPKGWDWDELTVDRLKEYVDKFPEEEVKALGRKPKKDRLVEFLEEHLGKVIIPLDTMIIPEDVILK